MNNFIPNINKLNNDKSIDNKEDNYFNSLTTETFSRNEYNSDVVNLSELNKEKLEYERDDVKMNNNNFGQPETNQAPAFGGRFFPSLEDEPTNMNMMGGLNNGPSMPVAPVSPEPMGVPTSPNMNNNLIDLTDISNEDESSSGTAPSFGPTPAPAMPTMPEPAGMPSMEQPMATPTPMGTNDFNSTINNSFEMPNMGANPMPSIESLQNNNPSVAPTTEPVSMDILNADFGAPQTMPNFGPVLGSTIPEPAVMPTPSMDMNMPQGGNFGGQIPNFDPIQQPMMDGPQTMPSFGPVPGPTMPEPAVMPTPSMNMNMPQGGNFGEPMTIPNIDNNVTIPTFDNNMGMPNMEINATSQKDVTPVTNTIKNLVNSLKEFGYNINIIEDDLINVSKLTIEIEK